MTRKQAILRIIEEDVDALAHKHQIQDREYLTSAAFEEMFPILSVIGIKSMINTHRSQLGITLFT